MKGGDHLFRGGIRIAECPQCPRHHGKTRHAGVLARRPGKEPLGIAGDIKGSNRLLGPVARLGETPHHEQQQSRTAQRVEQCRPVLARFGEGDDCLDCVQRLAQFAADRANGAQPVQYLQIFRSIAEPLAQLARPSESLARRG